MERSSPVRRLEILRTATILFPRGCNPQEFARFATENPFAEV
jgi:hypothetical protein